MKESDIMRQGLAELSHGDTRLFRMQSGTLWSGVIVRQTPDEITLRHYQAVKVGVPGMSDTIGITAGGKFAAIEWKRPGARTDPERLAAQLRFIATITRLGGLAGIASDVEGARAILTGRTAL